MEDEGWGLGAGWGWDGSGAGPILLVSHRPSDRLEQSLTRDQLVRRRVSTGLLHRYPRRQISPPHSRQVQYDFRDCEGVPHQIFRRAAAVPATQCTAAALATRCTAAALALNQRRHDRNELVIKAMSS